MGSPIPAQLGGPQPEIQFPALMKNVCQLISSVTAPLGDCRYQEMSSNERMIEEAMIDVESSKGCVQDEGAKFIGEGGHSLLKLEMQMNSTTTCIAGVSHVADELSLADTLVQRDSDALEMCIDRTIIASMLDRS